eukprot:Colp12_sorted_trinity150504_noHs@27627
MSANSKLSSHIYQANYPLYVVATRKDGKIILGGGGGASKTGVPNKLEVFTYNNENLDLVTDYDPGTSCIMSMALHPKQNLVACGLDGKCAILRVDENKGKFSVTSIKAQQTDFSKDPEDCFQKSVQFSNDGKLIVTGGYDTVARVWSFPEMKKLHELKKHTKDVNAVSIDPTGSYIATASPDTFTYIWDAKTGKLLQTLKSPSKWQDAAQFRIQSCRFVQQADGTVHLYTVHSLAKHPSYIVKWQPGQWVVVKDLKAEQEPITTFAASDDGSLLAAGTALGGVGIYTADLKRVLRVRGVHELFVTGVAFTQDNATLISVSADRSCYATKVQHQQQGGGVAVLVVVLLALVAVLLAWAHSQGLLLQQ